MNRSQILLTTGVVLTILAGCATGTTQPVTMSCGSDYTCLGDTAFQYRQQAAELSALAQRYEIDAQAKAREFGQDAEQVKRSRDLAMEYWSKAQEADEMARQYRRQMPHNVVQ
jgi:hypothetical protein